DFSFEKVPVAWSPDSSTVIYEKGGEIYFCDPKAAFQQVQMTEEFRRIGTGKINAVCWANNKTLVYIDRDVVYRVNANELYTRGMYAPMVGSGTVIGRLPVAFDSLKDRLYVNDKADRMVVLQGTHVVSSYRLASKGFAYLLPEYAKPFTDIRGSVIDFQLFWASDGVGVLWVDIIGNDDGALRSTVYRLSTDLKQLSVIDNPGHPVLSPDGKTLAFSSGETLYVYDISNWKNISRLSGEHPVSYAWNGNVVLYVGGVSTVREWKVNSKDEAKVLFLSAANTVCWRNDTSVMAQDAADPTVLYDYDMARNVWQRSMIDVEGFSPQYRVQNGRYRVFVGSTANQRYKNTLYIRNLTGGVENKALFPDTAVKTPAPKRVVLAFDATDSADGLTRILSVLKEYDVPATFFVNGEFVRRYPAESKQVAASGYECASMFFTNADLTGKGFVVDDDFIRRGLARNEDEFYAATGKELSLFWHAPYYRVTAGMKKAANASGYRYVDCGKWSLDTQTFEQALQKKEPYLTSSEIISYYAANARDMTILPVVIGISKGSRSDYLYDKLDLLITALWDAGYEIVPIRLFI
ncbi:MAG: polysaccharide deacetylase family protein, partial [Treponema sp.]|nr:polysaccharide deacetylase family protein [Treponema sp.]